MIPKEFEKTIVTGIDSASMRIREQCDMVIEREMKLLTNEIRREILNDIEGYLRGLNADIESIEGCLESVNKDIKEVV